MDDMQSFKFRLKAYDVMNFRTEKAWIKSLRCYKLTNKKENMD